MVKQFSVCAPKIWTTIPLEICQSSTVLLSSFLLDLLRVTRTSNGCERYRSEILLLVIVIGPSGVQFRE